MFKYRVTCWILPETAEELQRKESAKKFLHACLTGYEGLGISLTGKDSHPGLVLRDYLFTVEDEVKDIAGLVAEVQKTNPEAQLSSWDRME